MMIKINLYWSGGGFYLLFLLSIFFSNGLNAQKGTLSTRSQAEFVFKTVPIRGSELGVSSSHENYFAFHLDQSLMLQITNRIHIGLGLGYSRFKTDKFDLFSNNNTLSRANANHIRMSFYFSIESSFTSKVGMFHEFQFRTQVGEYDRLDRRSELRSFGDVNFFGLSYNPTLYYNLTEKISIEATPFGVHLFLFKNNLDNFNRRQLEIRPRTGILIGLKYKFLQ